MAVPQSIYDALPLNESQREIRLLHFENRKDSGLLLTVSMVTASLEDSSLSYNALSYCWGEPDFDHSVICNGTVVQITSGLFAALRRLENLPWGKKLWVDQLCINQLDLSERSSQVHMMRSIYSSSKICYSYLGEETPNTRLAFAYAQCRLRQNRPQVNFVGKLNEDLVIVVEPEELPATSVNDDLGAIALLQFASRPYFARGWITQEVTVSVNSLAICGEFIFQLMGIWEALQLNEGSAVRIHPDAGHSRTELFILATPSIDFGHTIRLSNIYGGRVKHQQPNSGGTKITASYTLFDLLTESRGCKVSDPRDKIYALISLATDGDAFPKPQYHTDVGTVFQNFAEAFVRLGRGLDCIRNASANTSGLSLPSWVPDWSERGPPIAPSLSMPRGTTFAARYSNKPQDAVRLGPHQGTIEVDAEKVCIVEEVVQLNSSYSRHDFIWSTLVAMEKIIATSDSIGKGNSNSWSRLYNFITEIDQWYSIDRVELSQEHADIFMKMAEEAKNGIANAFNDGTYSEKKLWEQDTPQENPRKHVADIVLFFILGHALARTSTGAVAIVPSDDTAVGDGLFYFRQAYALSLLRSNPGTGTYRFVGTACLEDWTHTDKDPDDWNTVILA